MASSPIRTIRAPAELWAFVDTQAKAQGIKPNAFVAQLIRESMKRRAPAPRKPDPKAVLAQAEAAAAHLAPAKPKMSERQRVWRAALDNVPVGPQASPPGSRLKTGKPTPPRR